MTVSFHSLGSSERLPSAPERRSATSANASSGPPSFSLRKRLCRDNGRGHHRSPRRRQRYLLQLFSRKDHILLAFSDMQLAKLEQSINGLVTSRQPLREFMRSLVCADGRPLRNPGMIRRFCWATCPPIGPRSDDQQTESRARIDKQMVEIGQERGEIRKDCRPGNRPRLRQTIFGHAADLVRDGRASLATASTPRCK